MNMLVNYVMKAMAASATIAPAAVVPQIRMELRPAYDRKGEFLGYDAHPVANHRRLKSRGKGGKTAHSFSGVRAQKRAAAKLRNRKG